MDLIFETSTSKHFSIEIGFFDTVLDIKEKVNKDHGYSISNQKLYFKGQELIDDHDIEQCGILQNSLIYLMVTDADADDQIIKVIVHEPISKQQRTFEAYANETVANFKHRISVLEAIPRGRFAVFYGGNELHEHRRLEEYGITDNSIVNLVMRLFASSSMPMSSDKVRVMVLPRAGGAEKIPVEFKGSDNVSDLRTEIQRLEMERDLVLPPHGYFFIHKENVMEEDKSFMWHDVKNGDTILVFDGCELKFNL